MKASTKKTAVGVAISMLIALITILLDKTLRLTDRGSQFLASMKKPAAPAAA